MSRRVNWAVDIDGGDRPESQQVVVLTPALISTTDWKNMFALSSPDNNVRDLGVKGR